MAIPDREVRILFQKSGNRCAFSPCGKLLTYVESASSSDVEISISDIAHIVAESLAGPRGSYPFPIESRNKAENLILLCKEHHRVIDECVPAYPVERLRGIKEDHENRIEIATGQATQPQLLAKPVLQTETLFGTFLEVTRMPSWIYSAECTVESEREIKDKIQRPGDGRMCPFILKGTRLYCFNDLRRSDHPFVHSTMPQWKKDRTDEWWRNEEKLGWFLTLANRSLNKLTGRKGLKLDKEHHRYYFEPAGDETNPVNRTIKYVPLNRGSSDRSVAWRPITKKTGLPKKHWHHLAVALRFLPVSPTSWCLTVRPELRITKDGFTVPPARTIGGRVTKQKSHSFNNNLLDDLQFWRSFLSDGRPEIICHFDPGQQIVVSSAMLDREISWPGMPEEKRLQFRNVNFEDDLFSLADRQRFDEQYEDEIDEDQYDSEEDFQVHQ